jgi:phosphoribosylanthranilate isomerase
MPSGPGPIPLETIAQATPPSVATFLLTSETQPEAILAQWRHCHTSTIQLTDATTLETRQALREALPGVKIVQVVHVCGLESQDEALALAEGSDALLLDSGRPGEAIKVLGGTGQTHDWSVSAAIVKSVPCPVFLAGGLRPENVAKAVRVVRPFGVDLCSGVRTEGRLDEVKLTAFCSVLRHASNMI